METKILPRHEWTARLKGTELEAVHPLLPPDAEVVIVEASGEIQACWACFAVLHVEGLWKRPTAGAGVGRALVRGTFGRAKARGFRTVVTASLDPKIDRMLSTIGAIELPGKHFVVKVEDERCQGQP